MAGRSRLSEPLSQKVRRIILADPKLSNLKIAEQTGMNRQNVAKVREHLYRTKQIELVPARQHLKRRRQTTVNRNAAKIQQLFSSFSEYVLAVRRESLDVFTEGSTERILLIGTLRRLRGHLEAIENDLGGADKLLAEVARNTPWSKVA